MRASACGFSIFAMRATSGVPYDAASDRTRRMSSADCTKLTATMSTPMASPAARSAASFSVTADVRNSRPGTEIPLFDSSRPPVVTVRLELLGRRRSDLELNTAIVNEQASAGRDRCEERLERARDA